MEAGENIEKKQLRESRYFRDWQLDGFEAENGIMYRYEDGRWAWTRQLRVKVVPNSNSLYMVVFTMCCASPMEGHRGGQTNAIPHRGSILVVQYGQHHYQPHVKLRSLSPCQHGKAQIIGTTSGNGRCCPNGRCLHRHVVSGR